MLRGAIKLMVASLSFPQPLATIVALLHFIELKAGRKVKTIQPHLGIGYCSVFLLQTFPIP